MKRFMALVLSAVIFTGTCTTSNAATPLYKPLSEYGYTGVPEIHVELSDEVNKSIEKVAEKAVEEYFKNHKINLNISAEGKSLLRKYFKYNKE